MDIRCKHCGEPIDVNEFDGNAKLIAKFQEFGCPAVDALFDGDDAETVTAPCNAGAIVSDDYLEAIDIVGDLLGDDIDGVASILDDMGDDFNF